MMKIVALALSLLFLALPQGYASAAYEPSGAKAAAVKAVNGSVIAELNLETSYPIAGLSRLPAILTLCLAFDDGILKEDAVISVSNRAAGLSGPTAFLEKGEQISAAELIKAAVMISAGDAICALAEGGFGSEDVFVGNVSVICEQLGLEIQLADCVGTGLTLSCFELLTLSERAMDSPTFIKWASVYMDNVNHPDGRNTELVNANRMIRDYSGCVGLLTGSSRDDGYCGVFAAKRGDTSYVCCVIGCKNSEERFALASKMFDYAFANFDLVSLSQAGEIVAENVPVKRGTAKSVNVVTHDTEVMLLEKGQVSGERSIELPNELSAPLYTDVAVGRICYYNSDGSPYAVIELYPEVEIPGKSLWELLQRLISSYLAA